MTTDASNPHPLQAEERLAAITAWLADKGRIEVGDVAARLRVAQETIRRDLRMLESAGKLQRVHGGAVLLPPDPVPAAGPISAAQSQDTALGEQVWSELPRTGTILLGAGRLTAALASVITQRPPERAGLTVVTNSLDVAIMLSRVSRLSVYNIGGSVSRYTRAQEGDWALSELGRLHTDVSVVSPAGLSATGGLTQATPAAAAVSRAEVEAGARVIALADPETLGTASFVRFADIEEVDHIAVAGRPDPAHLQALRDRGLSISIATEGQQL